MSRVGDNRLRTAIDRIVTEAENRPLLSAIDAAPRPRKREIIEILRLLQEVVYPGFYGDSVLYRANLHDHLGDVLFHIHLRLAKEIEKALPKRGRPGLERGRSHDALLRGPARNLRPPRRGRASRF